MVLHHIAHGSHRVVKAAPIQHVELLRHRDLHAFDVEVVPDRLQKGVGEAKEDHVLDRVLAQVVIDAKNIFFGKYFVHRFVERYGRPQVVAKRLFNHHPRPLRGARRLQLGEHLAEEDGWNGQIMDGMFGAP